MSPDAWAPVTVFCADDHPRFRGVAREVIAATPGFTQVGEAGAGEEAVTEVITLRPDLVLMDVHLPGIDGFVAAAVMVERRRDLVVVLMSASPIEPPPGYCTRGGEIALLPKEELCPRRLLDLWHGRRTRYPGPADGWAAHP